MFPQVESSPRPSLESRVIRAEELLTQLRAASSEQAKAALVEEIASLTLELADRTAQAYRHRGVEIDDLLQVARLGLVKAIRRYDPDRGHGFAAYAVPTVAGEIKRYFRDCGWLVRPPRALQELRTPLAREEETLRASLGREPTEDELAARLGVEANLIREGRAASRAYSAAPMELSGDDPKPQQPAGEGDPYQSVVDREVLRQALPTLTPRERMILRLRFYEDLTQAQISARVGVSQVQVSRILSASLSRLRALADVA